MNSSKSLLIAIAAFAVSTTGAQAYVGSKVRLAEAGLSSTQIEAFEVARGLRASGDVLKARDVLVEAGIDEEALLAVKQAHRASKEAMQNALQLDDFMAFRNAVVDTPLFDVITTDEDFELFKEAHELRAKGDHEEAKEIFAELGIGGKSGHTFGRGRHSGGGHRDKHFTDGERDALRVARQANDPQTMRAIMDEAGVFDRHGRL